MPPTRCLHPTRILWLLVIVWLAGAHAQVADARIYYGEGLISYVPMAGHTEGVWEPWSTLIAHTMQLLAEHPDLFRTCNDVRWPQPGEVGRSPPYLIVYIDYPMEDPRWPYYTENAGSVEVFLEVQRVVQPADGSNTRERLYYIRLYAPEVELRPPEGTHVPVDAPTRNFHDHATEIAKLFIELQIEQLVEIYRLEDQPRTSP